ncbi:MAG: Fic family protein [Ruminococcaceae bacterium]|nr:Fic family protein [Oscillospiraceae bacterium]
MSVSEQIYQAFNYKCVSDKLGEVKAFTEDFERLKPFSPEETDGLQSYNKAFMSRFVYNSNAIEGSTLSLGDTALVLEGEFPPHDPNTNLKDIFAAKGCYEGSDYANVTFQTLAELTEDFIKNVHEKTALDCQPRTRGTYRISPVYINGSRTVPVDAYEIRNCMADLVYQYNNCQNDPLVKIAAFHAMFERIHPFTDGNGRTGRNILNAMLIKEGYSEVAIKFALKGQYNSSLESWQVDNDPEPFINLFIDAVIEETKERIKVIELTREMDKTIPDDTLNI